MEMMYTISKKSGHAGNRYPCHLLLALLLGALITPVTAAIAETEAVEIPVFVSLTDHPLDLADYRWKHRFIVVCGQSKSEDSKQFMNLLEEKQEQIRFREMLVIDLRDKNIGDPVLKKNFWNLIARRINLRDNRFQALLVGKDGGIKQVIDNPVDLEKLFATVDALPMRQHELRQYRQKP